jgi:hypothetical protein
MGQRTSVYLDDDLHAAVKASGVPLAELARRGLAAPAVPDTPATVPAPSLTLPASEPSPGAVCSGPRCWNRDTARYGFRRLILRRSCAGALKGETYKGEPPPLLAPDEGAADCRGHRDGKNPAEEA